MCSTSNCVLTHIGHLRVCQTHKMGISRACESVVNAERVDVLDAALLEQIKEARSALWDAQVRNPTWTHPSVPAEEWELT